MSNIQLCYLLCLLAVGCFQKPKEDIGVLTDEGLLHRNSKQLTEVIIHDAFSPPVASRIYAYTSLAAYEAIRFDKPGYPSITAMLHGFASLPAPQKDKPYNYLLAASKAYSTVAEKITFSRDTLLNYQSKLFSEFQSLLDRETYERSLSFGQAIGEAILERTKKDNYKETRGMSKFLGSNAPGKWRLTAPDYLDAAEPYWGQIKPLAIDSAGQFKCPPPPAYNTDQESGFYKMVHEVYSIARNLTDEQKTIAKYWDDNPFVLEHSGHLVYATKKITPVGHWMGIAGIACKKEKLDAVATAQTYASTATAIFDAFISCWDEKYRIQYVRPITVINELIDRSWQPMLQTPPFPEYISGHSMISAAAAAILSERFGDRFAFEDTSDLEYIGMKRNFQSFKQAAQEASISRVYGGIHYRNSVEVGFSQGEKIGTFIQGKLKLAQSLTALHQ